VGRSPPPALAASAWFPTPSLHATFGIGYPEAWLHERPVVGGDIPPLREAIAHGVDGFCVRQRADDVAAAIQRLLDDPALRSTMGRAGSPKLAQKCDWDPVIDRGEAAYARALAHANADAGEPLASNSPRHEVRY